MAEKKGGLLEGFEAPLNTGVRGVIREQLPKFMEWLRSNHTDLYNAGTWAFTDKSPEASQLKTKVMTGLVVVGWLGERFVDLFGSQSAVAKVVEMAMGDLPLAIGDYYERTKPALPVPYDPPKADQFDGLIKRLRELLVGFYLRFLTDSRAWLEAMIKALQSWKIPIIGNPFGSSFGRFLAVMFQNQDEKVLRGWRAFYKRNLKDKPDPQRVFLSMCGQFDTQKEWDGFFVKLANAQDELFDAATQLHGQSGLHGLHNKATEAIVGVGKSMLEPIVSLDALLEARRIKREARQLRNRHLQFWIGGAALYLFLVHLTGGYYFAGNQIARWSFEITFVAFPLVIFAWALRGHNRG